MKNVFIIALFCFFSLELYAQCDDVFDCLRPNSVDEIILDLCNGDQVDPTLVADWQAAIEAANPINATTDPCGWSRIAYSYTRPVSGVTPPDELPFEQPENIGCFDREIRYRAYLLCDVGTPNDISDDAYLYISEMQMRVYPDIEFIVTDDGTSCGTPRIAAASPTSTCYIQMATNACTDTGDTFDYDFSTESRFGFLATDPAGCGYAGYSGTITCNCENCPVANLVISSTTLQVSPCDMSEGLSWVANVEAANPLDAAQDPNAWGSIVYSLSPSSSTYYNSFEEYVNQTSFCRILATRVYVWVKCDQGTTDPSDDEYDQIGFSNIDIYPDLEVIVAEDGANCTETIVLISESSSGVTCLDERPGECTTDGETIDYDLTDEFTTYVSLIAPNYDPDFLFACVTNSEELTGTFTCDCAACPEANTLNDRNGFDCEGSNESLQAWQADVVAANPLDATQDPSAWGSIAYSSSSAIDGVRPPDGFIVDGSHTGNCSVDVYTTYAYLVCDNGTADTSDDTYQEIGTFDLYIYPNISVEVSDNGSTCGTPSVDLLVDGNICATQVADAACSTTGDTFDYDFLTDIRWLDDAPAECNYDYTGTISCSCCPVANSVDRTFSFHCEGSVGMLSDWQAAVEAANPLDAAQDPNGWGSIAYSSVFSLSNPPNNILPDGSHTGTCDIEAPETYAFLVCDFGTPDPADDTYQHIGTFVSFIFPAITIEVSDDGTTCGTPSVTLLVDGNICATQTADAACSTTGETFDYDFSTDLEWLDGFGTPDECNYDYTGTLSCACCPTANTLNDRNGFNCEGSNESLQAWQADVVAANLLDATQDPNGWGSIAYSSSSAIDGIRPPDGFIVDGSHTGNCSVDVYTTYAYLVCDNGTTDTSDDTYQEIGTFDLYIYPNISVEVTDNGSTCGTPSVDLLVDGNICATQVADAACSTTGDTFDYDFLTDIRWLDDAPAECNYDYTGTISCACCPAANIITNEQGDACVGSTAGLSDWQTALEAANPLDVTQDVNGWGSIAYSSIPAVDGTTPPDGLLADGSHSGGCDLEIFTTYAYLVCDYGTTDPADDTYSLISTYELTVYPNLTVVETDNGATCGTPSVNLVSVDASVCATQTATAACGDTGDTFDYDFSTDLTWLASDPAGCAYDYVGTITCNCCSTATLVTPPMAACHGSEIEICYELFPSAEGSVLTIEGISSAMGAAGETVLCVNVPVSNTGCDILSQSLMTNISCAYGGVVTDLTGTILYNGSADAGPVDVYPDPANFEISVSPSATCGEAPIVLDSACPSISQGWVSQPINGCPGTDGTYQWTQSFPFDISAGMAATCGYVDASGSEVVSACTVEEFMVNCNDQVSEGSQGGVGVFYYNTREICISGGTAPYTIDWSSVGYVRQAIMENNEDGFKIRILYADNATWGVKIYDANACSDANWEFSNDMNMGSDGDNAVLDIKSSDVEADNCYTAFGDGSISIVATGGSQSAGTSATYEYVWQGPFTWDGTGQGTNSISNCTKGWYSVTVTEMMTSGTGNSVAMGDQTEGWFWVNCTRPGGRGKINQTELAVIPNPVIDATQISFGVAETTYTQIELYSLDGRKVATVYQGSLEGGVAQILDFDASVLEVGMYMLQLTTENGEQLLEKMMVVR